ncbi:MAG: signal peptide peptidase SppA, partial [Gammaproteobacteria bacterium]|nr:signal peptide peptidase SppA [Gammaproteobacteria bacterium]
DFAKMALDSKLVTGLKTLPELRAMLIERGAKDEVQKTFRQVSLNSYLSQLKPTFSGDAVGVIVAEGEIGDGASPPGKIGGRSTAKLIRQARDDDSIKAIVLRVNSPGGSAYGSELIRHELELTRAAGKPVVVSMGNVAASGGYWIAMSSDELLADAATITGSIGVFGILPTAEKTMQKLSLYTGGYNTTWLGSAMYDPRRALDPRIAEIVQLGVQRIYDDFTTKAAAFRKTTPDKIDEVAQGRVWTGTQAKERNLIDRTGTFADAITAARSRAKLDEKSRVAFIEAERSKLDMFIEQFGGAAIKTIAAKFASALDANAPPLSSAVASVANVNEMKKIEQDLVWLAEMTANNKSGIPFAVVAHCLCDVK